MSKVRSADEMHWSPRSKTPSVVSPWKSSGTFGPGHVDGSAVPGKDGVSLIAGHRDTHFRLLEDLRLGDAITVEDRAGLRHVFRVTSLQVVDARRVRIDTHAETPRLALSTCYPIDALTPGGPLRYLVFADAIEAAVDLGPMGHDP